MTRNEPDLPKILAYRELDEYEPGDRVWIPTKLLDRETSRGAIVEIVEHREVNMDTDTDQ